MSLRRFFITTLAAVFKNIKSFKFDGVNDFLNWNTINADISLLTSGAVSVWIKVPSDDNTQRTFFSISRDADTTITELSFIVDFRESVGAFPGNSFTFLSLQDSVEKWTGNTGANFLNPHIGNWIHFVMSHNGTEPTLYVNGSPVTITYQTSTDKTLWFKGILTDATNDADTCSVGILRRNSTPITAYNENVDEVAIYDDALSAGEVTAIYNSGVPIDLEELSSSTKLVSWLRMGDDPLDDDTDGTGVIKDQVNTNDATPTNTAGDNIEADVPS